MVAYSLDNQCGLASLFAATTSEVMSAKHSSAPSPSASLALPLLLLSINPLSFLLSPPPAPKQHPAEQHLATMRCLLLCGSSFLMELSVSTLAVEYFNSVRDHWDAGPSAFLLRLAGFPKLLSEPEVILSPHSGFASVPVLPCDSECVSI